jgi:hypothetical protein
LAYKINVTDIFADWFTEQEEALQNRTTALINLLMEEGPRLGRPHADTLLGSKVTIAKCY